jgi:hypothetical protein
MTKYEMSQRVEIHGLPENAADAIYNGCIGTVVALPGYNTLAPKGYGVRFDSGIHVGSIVPCIDKFLRPFPPKLPNGRGDIDKLTSWAEFDKVTGLESIGFRRPNHDY